MIERGLSSTGRFLRISMSNSKIVKLVRYVYCPKCMQKNKSTARRCIGITTNLGSKERCDFYWIKQQKVNQ